MSDIHVMRLRMELDLDRPSPEEWYLLRKYGKMDDGITREVLVPDTMTLHALHYVIQKAFGWQNSHLHHFALPEEEFRRCTGGSFSTWGRLCGVYFRFPTDDLEDLYWDDDYDGRLSLNTWLKRKYCGPYRYAGRSERYMDSQLAVKAFYRDFPVIEILRPWNLWDDTVENPVEKVIDPRAATIDEVFRSIEFESDANTLLERLTLGEVLCTGDRVPDQVDIQTVAARPVTDQLIYHYDYGDGWVVHLSLLEEAADEVQNALVRGEKPLCIARDGVNVLDDVGGIHGFCTFLEELHEGDPEQRQALRQWAKIFGWTGRISKPENIL